MTQAQTAPESSPDPANASTDDIVVKALGLTKVFKDFWLRDKVRAVDAIDFEILRGEVFGLLGPNGSGKSTTIKMILGLLHPTSGKLAVFGNLPRDVQTKKRIGYLPEETYLYKFLTPVETLEYYAKLFHLPRGTRKKRIDMLLDMVGLEHAANRPVGEFSKGMMRKVGLAQALHGNGSNGGKRSMLQRYGIMHFYTQVAGNGNNFCMHRSRSGTSHLIAYLKSFHIVSHGQYCACTAVAQS